MNEVKGTFKKRIRLTCLSLPRQFVAQPVIVIPVESDVVVGTTVPARPLQVQIHKRQVDCARPTKKDCDFVLNIFSVPIRVTRAGKISRVTGHILVGWGCNRLCRWLGSLITNS